jgi:G3E family GTPase
VITLTTLVTGATSGAREAAIAAVIDVNVDTAIIVEGLPDTSNPFLHIANSPHIHIARIAPGCLCCIGSITMRVTLNRMLQRQPARLFISLASSEHLTNIHNFLSQAPYNTLLSLTNIVDCKDKV